LPDPDDGGSLSAPETDYTYDAVGTHTHDTTTIADYDWTFDAFSRITSLSFTSSVGDSGDSDYTYDDTGQLTDVDHDYQTDESYSYDENGNRTMSGYTTDDNNLTTSDGTYDYEYDDEGNRVLKTNSSTGDYTAYEWDHRNRLTRIAQYDSSDTLLHEVEYTYDVYGRRITKEIDADGAGGGGVETIQYVYDGDAIVFAFDGSDALTNRYLQGPMVDQILASEDDTGDVLWALTDNLGSVRDLVENDGTVANHITYDAYGNVTSETASSVDHIYAFTGRERDEESDLQFNRARYYDAAIGQWVSEDPIEFLARDSNLRRYASNASTNATDPSGLIEPDKLEELAEKLGSDSFNEREDAASQLLEGITSLEDLMNLESVRGQLPYDLERDLRMRKIISELGSRIGFDITIVVTKSPLDPNDFRPSRRGGMIGQIQEGKIPCLGGKKEDYIKNLVTNILKDVHRNIWVLILDAFAGAKDGNTITIRFKRGDDGSFEIQINNGKTRHFHPNGQEIME
jgi:RHS repeat-associated protein